MFVPNSDEENDEKSKEEKKDSDSQDDDGEEDRPNPYAEDPPPVDAADFFAALAALVSQVAMPAPDQYQAPPDAARPSAS